MSDDMTNGDDLESYASSVQNINTVITLIAVIHIIAGILTIPLVYIIFSSSIFEAPLIVTFMLIFMGSILALTVPISITLGWAIWCLQPWAWKIAMVVNVTCLFLNIIGGIVLIALLNIVLLLALNGTDVKLALTPPTDTQDSIDRSL
ncbi:MAG: hypothetical protein ACTSV2_16170 [Candidatus Thorarchaeota archaeon]